MITKPALRLQLPQAPQGWWQLPHGRWLQQQVATAVNRHCQQVFGYYALRVGALAADLELPDLRVQHQFSMATQAPAAVCAELSHWPFAEQTLDAVLLVQQLEFAADPHQLLREATHSLVNDGYLILVGMNPLSPALLTGIWPGRIDAYPWHGRYFTRARVADWLALLNYQLLAAETIAPSLLIDSVPPTFGLATLNRLWLGCGAMYVLVARKRRYPLTVVRSKQRQSVRQTRPIAVAQRHY